MKESVTDQARGLWIIDQKLDHQRKVHVDTSLVSQSGCIFNTPSKGKGESVLLSFWEISFAPNFGFRGSISPRRLFVRLSLVLIGFLRQRRIRM